MTSWKHISITVRKWLKIRSLCPRLLQQCYFWLWEKMLQGVWGKKTIFYSAPFRILNGISLNTHTLTKI